MAVIAKYRLGSRQVAELAGIPYRTLDRWIRSGLLTCSTSAKGTGTRREFSLVDVVRVRVVAQLRRQGVSLQTVRRVVRELTERWGIHDPLTQSERLVVSGDKLFWDLDDSALLDAVSGQLAARPFVIVPLNQIADDTSEQMARLCAA